MGQAVTRGRFFGGSLCTLEPTSPLSCADRSANHQVGEAVEEKISCVRSRENQFLFKTAVQSRVSSVNSVRDPSPRKADQSVEPKKENQSSSEKIPKTVARMDAAGYQICSVSGARQAAVSDLSY
jgi:hypothetical protein